MEDQGYPTPTTPAAPSQGVPLAPAPNAPPQAQYPPPTVAPSKSSSAWKWFVGVVAVLILAIVACCGLSVVAVGGLGEGAVPVQDSIALIHLDGVIAGTGSALDGVITPEDMIEQLQAAQDDPNVKAILLRVDSPGGTVAASQEISTEIARLDKPIVVSIGDVGASGAYMVSSQCDEIIAQPTSAVGSIGVITEIPNVSGLLEKVGVEFTVLTAGKYKDAGSPYRSLTPTETELIQQQVDIAYDEFINIVAEGRDLPVEKVREMATGWAWSGREAKEMGLVDGLGTYTDALDRAAELGGIEGEPAVVTFDQSGPYDFLYSLLGIKDSLDRIGALSPESGTYSPAVPK